jgi:hypothetical protein
MLLLQIPLALQMNLGPEVGGWISYSIHAWRAKLGMVLVSSYQ